MQIPFFIPEIGDEEISAVTEVLKSGWLTTGKHALEFEALFSKFTGAKYSLAVNSATSGLHLGLEALGVGPGDEVIVPTQTFTATAEVVQYLGATPVFIDVDPKTLCITPDLVKAAITEKTKAVMPVHFGGYPIDLAAIASVTKSKGIKILDDAAHALPAMRDGNFVGNNEHADATVFSFYSNKTITTGEGGMLTTSDSQIAKRCSVMRLHGIDRDAFDRFSSDVPGWVYDVIAPGFKYNLTDIAAAIGIVQLSKAEDLRKRRENCAKNYFHLLRGLALELPTAAPDGDVHSWHLFPIRLRDKDRISRNDVVDALFSKGIKCSVHYRPLHKMTYWQEQFNLTDEMFPISSETYNSVLSLPLFPSMNLKQQEYVSNCLKEILA